MEALLAVFIIALFGAVVVAPILYRLVGKRKRVQALGQFAAMNRLRFSPDGRNNITAVFPKVWLLNEGTSRQTSNIMCGKYLGHNIEVCDYQYTTQNEKQSYLNYSSCYSCYVLYLPVSFGWLNVTPEGFYSKIAQAFGYDDIDFESAEFSRRYCVRAQNRKEAYAIITPQMMDYLMATRGLYFFIHGKRLLIAFRGQLKARDIPQRLKLLLGLATRIPDYLLAQKNDI